ncbi:MAG: HD domain-containing phosphohydrolase [Acidimicrobiales bacterium]|jgi:HD-GYP domain-containing protein (c-di-GMP phosphodiesterase class II)
MTTDELKFDPHRDLLPLVYSSRFLDTFGIALLLRDTTGAIIDSNRAAQELLSFSATSIKGQIPFDSRWNPVREDGSSFPLNEQPGLATLQTGKPMRDVIVGVDTMNQARKWLSINTFPIFRDDQLRGEVCSLTDVTIRRQEQQVMRLVTEMNKLVIQADNEDEFLNQVSNLLVEVGGYALVAFVLGAEEDEPEMIGVHMAGTTDYVHEETFAHMGPRAVGQGPVATAFRTRVTQVANDLSTHAFFETAWRQRAAQYGIASVIAIPIMLGRRKTVLTIYGKRPHVFDELTVSGLESIAREAEFGANHVRAVKQLEEALDGTLAAISRIIETKDSFTSGHHVHVGELAAAIATDMGFDEKMVKLIHQSGEVHDVGRIEVPSEILSFPGSLTPEQFEIVKRHTVVGADVLAQASLPWPLAEIAAQHHERLDGSGYPLGLRGEQIIMPARIMAVADVVEAMTQPRPYRPALGVEAALEEITSGSATLYDAQVVNSCVAIFKAGFNFETGHKSESSRDWAHS